MVAELNAKYAADNIGVSWKDRVQWFTENVDTEAVIHDDAHEQHAAPPPMLQPQTFSWLNGVTTDSPVMGYVPYAQKDESGYAYKIIYYR